MQFYYDAAESPGDKRQACYKNLKNLNVRPDLVKLSEVVDVALFHRKQHMPRFALQANSEQYETLWRLLERQDSTCAGTWELIRMLATNDKQYMEVIRMSSVTDEDGQVNWSALSESSNAFQKTYLQEIILSILEDAEESNDQVKRIMFVEEQQVSTGYSIAKPAHKDDAAGRSLAREESPTEEEAQAEIADLRLNWSRNFLEKGGF